MRDNTNPYIASFYLYRWWIGGTWRKYAYLNQEFYWTQDDLDYACGEELKLLETQKF